jgi:hypothetical protein
LVAEWYADATGYADLEQQRNAETDPIKRQALSEELAAQKKLIIGISELAAVGGTAVLLQSGAEQLQLAKMTANNAAANNYLNHTVIDRALQDLESCQKDCEPLRQQVAAHLSREHSELTGQGSQIPVHRVERDCVLNGCAGVLQDIDKGLAILQDPRVRELLGDTVVQGLIERQIMDLSRVYDYHVQQGYTPAPELAWRATKTLIEVGAIYPKAKGLQYVSLVITGTEVADKATSGDGTGAAVQLGAAVGSARFAGAIHGSLDKTGVYSQSFIDWIKNIYQYGADKAVTGVYEASKEAGTNSSEGKP